MIAGMRIALTQSGGFAGLVKRVQVDTATLPRDDAARLERLAHAARAALAAGTPAADPALRDARRYALRIDDDAASACWDLPEAGLPPAVRALLGWLRARAR